MAWRMMMWVGVLVSLAMAEGDLDADSDVDVPQGVGTVASEDSASNRHTARTWVEGEKVPSDDDLKYRFTVGIGISSYGLSRGGRGLLGKRSGQALYGFQASDLREIQLVSLGNHDYPDRSLTSFHVLAGWNVVPKGAVSWVWLGGLGASVAQGPIKPARNYEPSDPKQNQLATLPTAFLGMDLGGSFRRHVGLSLQAGAVVSRNVATYFMLQLDVGAW